ncbi:alpha/beta hydrolase [Lentzea sp. NBRC 105346]|uniref:alpha/beta fold hydrolase n=1 Tax=Lentzea sp. NBRC 105346 TaxID=3032205 RepID=UPI0024A38904|nr:alpha/beta fold hydrolase [Lentzea sp. NBRC 105346]GLZ35841.1 alpha/beta hydrolase [Lentzea sp. NBRC 105346]
MASLVLDRLNVVESGAGEVTAVLLHGWTLDHTSWDRVAPSLPGRVVRYDHRGHGASGAGLPATIEELADDLALVLSERVPTGRIVLAGHSMGGMTIMALAEAHPAVFERVSGVALVATSCGDLPPVSRVERLLGTWMARRSTVGFARVMSPGIRVGLFGKGASWSDVRASADAIGRCDGPSFGGFRDSLSAHQRREALRALAGIPTVVLAGGADRLTPLRHARALAEALPHAELVIYPRAGHMLPLERSTDVAGRIAHLM